MATTGFEFDKLWQRRVDKSYNGYYGKVQRKRLYKQALFYTVEEIYNNLVKHSSYDEIRSMIKTGREMPLQNGEIDLTLSLLDYAHFLNATAVYSTSGYKIAFFKFYPNEVVTAYLDRPIPARTGSMVKISGCEGMPEANGTFYLKQVGRLTYHLYTDERLKNKVKANSMTGSEANVEIYIKSKVDLQVSLTGKRALDAPSVYEPVVILADNKMKVFPTNAEQLILDYVTKPPMYIDPEDDVNDLEEYYPMKFLYKVIDKAAQIFDVETKDVQSFQSDVAIDKQNP